MRIRKRMPEGTRRLADGAAKSEVRNISAGGKEDGGFPVVAELPRSDTSSWVEERVVRLWRDDILPRMARFAARRKLTAAEEGLVEQGAAFLAAKGLRPR